DVRGRDEIQGLWDFVAFYGLFQSYSAHTALGGLQQAWTLTNEVAFYLLLPVWAWAASRLGRRLAPRRAAWARRAGGSPGSTGCGRSPPWACWSPTSA
ncbi:MAG: hypothetical protein ACRD0R_12540, partial [Acidimicrobiales bacterium]